MFRDVFGCKVTTFFRGCIILPMEKCRCHFLWILLRMSEIRLWTLCTPWKNLHSIVESTPKFRQTHVVDSSDACRSVTARALRYTCQPCSTLPLSYRSVNVAAPQYDCQSYRSMATVTLRHGFCPSKNGVFWGNVLLSQRCSRSAIKINNVNLFCIALA